MFQSLSRFSFSRRVGLAAGLTAVLVSFVPASSPQAAPSLLFGGLDVAGDVAIDTVTTAPLSILSFSAGVSNSGATAPGGGGGAGKATFNEVKITKYVDATSPKLFLNSATGRHLPKVTVRARKKGSSENYLVVTLENVTISSYQTSGTGALPPTEEVSFVFTRISLESGGQRAGFDLRDNTPF